MPKGKPIRHFEAGRAFFLPQHMIYFFIFPFGGISKDHLRTTRKKVFRPLWDFEAERTELVKDRRMGG